MPNTITRLPDTTNRILLCGPAIDGPDCGSFIARQISLEGCGLPQLCIIRIGHELAEKSKRNPKDILRCTGSIISACVTPIFYNGRLDTSPPNCRVDVRGAFCMDRGGRFEVTKDPRNRVNIQPETLDPKQLKRIIQLALKSSIASEDSSYAADLVEVLRHIENKKA